MSSPTVTRRVCCKAFFMPPPIKGFTSRCSRSFGKTALVPPARTEIACADVDNAARARLATEHLLSLGHTKIAHLTGSVNQYSVHQRRQAFTDVMEERGLSVPEPYVLPTLDLLRSCQ